MSKKKKKSIVEKYKKPKKVEATGYVVVREPKVKDSEEIEAMKDDNCFYRSRALKNANLELPLTDEHKEEIKKVATDIHYFCKNYMFVQHPSEGVMLFNTFEFQDRMIETFYRNRKVIGMLPRQSGKCVDGKTKIRIRNKHTQVEEEITFAEFVKRLENS